MSRPVAAFAAFTVLCCGPAVSAERPPDAVVRSIAATASLDYLACQTAARDAVSHIKGRVAGAANEQAVVTACIAKARNDVDARIPDLNAATAGSQRARILLKDWYSMWVSSLDRLTVDVANLREVQNGVPDLQARLDKLLAELRW